MSNTKENFFAVLRALLTFAGTFLIGHNLFGKTLDSSTAEIVIGAVVSLGGIIWGLIDKTTGIDTALSALRSVLLVIGGLGVSWGLLSANTFESIISLVTALIPILQSSLGKAKVVQLSSGQIVPEKVAPTAGATPVANGKTLKAA